MPRFRTVGSALHTRERLVRHDSQRSKALDPMVSVADSMERSTRLCNRDTASAMCDSFRFSFWSNPAIHRIGPARNRPWHQGTLRALGPHQTWQASKHWPLQHPAWTWSGRGARQARAKTATVPSIHRVHPSSHPARQQPASQPGRQAIQQASQGRSHSDSDLPTQDRRVATATYLSPAERPPPPLRLR